MYQSRNFASSIFFSMLTIITMVAAAITVSVNTTVLKHHGEWITINVTGVTSPQTSDWIGAYSPSSGNLPRKVPVKYQFCSTVNPQWASNVSITNASAANACSVTWRMLNLRTNYVFAFMRNGISRPSLGAKSVDVSFANYNEPTQIHLTY